MAIYRANMAAHTQGHNTATFAGLNQLHADGHVRAPRPNNTWSIGVDSDTVCGVTRFYSGQGYSNGEEHTANASRPAPGVALHTRSLVHLRGKAFVVVDRFTSDRPRTARVFWHAHPDVHTSWDAGSATLRLQHMAGPESVTIASAAAKRWANVSIVRGSDRPIQGWYSPHYNVKEPSDASIFEQPVRAGSTVVAWLIVASKEPGAAAPMVEIVSATDDAVTVTYRLGDGANATLTVAMCSE